MKNKWENANHMIEAKKCIDSFMYISQNENELSNLNLREKVDKLRQHFYINLTNVLDEYFKISKEKKAIKKEDEIIERIYYERDKKSAHDDENYKPRTYSSYKEEITDKKQELSHVCDICCEILPDITLDYVPHDKELFRIVNRVNANLEEKINKIKHPYSSIWNNQYINKGKDVLKNNLERYPLQSVEDVRAMSDDEKKKHAVIFDDGINTYEGLQNRQDSCIKINYLFGCDCWCSANYEYFERIEQLKKIGFLNIFEIPQLEILKRKDKMNEVIKIFFEKL